MVNIVVKIKGLEEFETALKRVPAQTIKELSKAVQKTVGTIQNQAIREAPYGKFPHFGTQDARRLRQRITSKMTTKLTGVIESEAPYSAAVHEGSRPHIIVPINKRVLYSRNINQFFGRRVRHPGTQPNPFLERAIQKSVKKMEEFFGTALQNVLNMLK
jgi:HK97 gp10 family phage protein